MSGAVPELRFPGFECSWEVRTLGEFMSFKNGVNADKSQYGTGRKFINVLDIIEAGPITHDRIIGSVDIPVAEFEKNEVKYGDILFQRSSETREEVGQSNVYLDPERTASFGGFVIRGRLHELVNPRFLDNLLKTSSVRKDITSRSGGSTRFNIGQESLGSVEVCMPLDEAERSKIADFFDQVSSKISLLKNQVDELRQFKTGLMQRLFSQELRFTREDGSDFPDWEERKLGELLEVEMGQSPSSGTYNDHGEGLPLIQGNADISNRRSAPRRYTSAPTKVCEAGDILISVRAPIGEVSRATMKACLGRGMAYVRSKESVSEFWYQFLLFMETSWYRVGQGSTFSAISGADIRNLSTKAPHPDEQARIADALSALDAKIDAVTDQITHMETFKKGLLQKMFV